MSKCHNPNTSEYKSLLNRFKSPFVVDMAINEWQSMTNDDSIPTVAEVDYMKESQRALFSLKKEDFSESVLRNLSNKGIISKYHGVWYVNNTYPGSRMGSPSALRDNIDRLGSYLKNIGIDPSIANIRRTKKSAVVSFDYNKLTRDDIIEEKYNKDSTRINDIVSHLSSIMPEVNIRYMKVSEAEAAWRSLSPVARGKIKDFSSVKSFFYNGTAVLIKGRVTSETAVEEVLHPFVDALFNSNKPLLRKLYSEAKRNFPKLATQIEAAYPKKKGFSEKDRAMELVTQALSRHFNKEYEQTPTRKWYEALQDFLKWFGDFIKDVYKNYMGGKLKLDLGYVNSNMTLSEIARMLNTSEVEFDLNLKETGDKKVKYSLSKGKQSTIDKIKKAATTDAQADIIDLLFHQQKESENTFDNLSSSRVTWDNENKTYTDQDTGENYISVTELIKGDSTEIDGDSSIGKTLGEDFSSIIEAVTTGVPFNQIAIHGTSRDIAEKVYNDLSIAIDSRRDDGSIFLPQVVLNSEMDNAATTSDILKIDPEGQITIMSIRTSSQSKHSKEYRSVSNQVGEGSIFDTGGDFRITNELSQSIKLGTQVRMLQNMGFDVNDVSLTLHLIVNSDGNYNYEGTSPHKTSENLEYIEDIVPEYINVESKEVIDEILGKQRELVDEEEDIETETEDIGAPVYDVIYNALKDFRKSLLTREEAIKSTRNIIHADKGRKEMIEDILITRTMIEQVYDDPGSIRQVYVDLMKESIDKIEEFITYSTDHENFGKEEFISKILNWQKFVENYRGLINLTSERGLNKTELRYKSNLQSALNKLVGIRSNNGKILDKGIFDVAIENHVRTIIREKSNRDFSESQLTELLQKAQDINEVEYQSGDMATSRDTILAIMDKIFKRDRQRIQDKIEARAPRIRSAALKLERLGGRKDIDYSFMLEFDKDGNFTGRYVKKTSQKYFDKLNELRSALSDETGAPLDYIIVEDANDPSAKPEQLEFNKRLARAKDEYKNYKKAEIVHSDRTEDGEYHKYSDEFKEARAKNEIFIPKKNGKGWWMKRESVSREQYNRYRSKYYIQKDEYAVAVRDKNGDPTGEIEYRDLAFVSKDHVEIRYETNPDLINEKWKNLQEPKTELEKAQSEFYNMFIDVYEDELLGKLPENVYMNGKVPIIERALKQKVKDKNNIVSRIWAKMKTTAKNFFSNTTTIKKVFLDENGHIIHNSLPIFFTGSGRKEQDLKLIQEQITDKEKEARDSVSQAEKDAIEKELRILRGKQRALESKPETSKLSMNMADSLLKFSAMAENYETMAQAEDTYLSMIKVLESRNYTNSRGEGKEVMGSEYSKSGAIGSKDAIGAEARITKRAKKWMKMVYYNNDQDTKNFFEKVTKGLISYTSLAYVGANVFGNFNNYLFGRLSNQIETLGQRFYTTSGMAKSVLEFNKRMMPDMMRHLGQVAQEKTGRRSKNEENPAFSKFGAVVGVFRMLDDKKDMREQGETSDLWGLLTNWAYVLQDAGEFNVQTKVGVAILNSITALNYPEDGGKPKTMSLYDALDFDRKTGELKMKEGYTKIKMYNSEKEMDWNADTRYEIRNYIRESNKQIHGNYAYEDRMVMQSHALGQLAAQFHKWVAPAVKTRFRQEYFDENLGWIEGRYRTMWNFLGYTFKNLSKAQTLIADYKEFHGEKGRMKMQNVMRVVGEIGVISSVYILKTLLMGMWGIGDDDDDSDEVVDLGKIGAPSELSDTEKRLQNIAVYHLDRLYDETILFVPIPGLGGFQQIGEFLKSPLASTRTMGEMGEAIEMTIGTGFGLMYEDREEFWNDKDYVYVRGHRKGELKIAKEWGDIIPIWYTKNKWKNFLNQTNFFIK